MAKWTAAEIPDLKGRTAVVTGTGGLGLEIALQLARAGAGVVIAGRDPRKGLAAIARVRGEVAQAAVRFEELDLASLQSVASFGERLRTQQDRLDLLVNNAAVMTPPQRRTSSDGLELQFATNYLGHFALTAGLLPLLRAGQQTRVVTLSSIAARDATIAFEDLQAAQGYQPMRVYGQSKLACLIFALELDRRSKAGRWNIASLAAHPGVSRTDLLHNGAGAQSLAGMARSYLWFLFQPAAQGALPALFAATSPQAQAGSYYGPDKLGETRGYPALSRVPALANDPVVAERLWKVSESLAGVSF